MKLILLLTLAITNLYPQEGSTPDTIWSRQYGDIISARFSTDGSKVIITEPGAVYVLDSETGDEIYKDYMGGFVYDEAFLTNNNKLLFDHSGQIINIETGEKYSSNGMTTGKGNITHNKNNDLFYGLSATWVEGEAGNPGWYKDPKIMIFDPYQNKVLNEVELTIFPIKIVSSNDGKWLAISGQTNGNQIDNPTKILRLYEVVDNIPVFRKEVFRGSEFSSLMTFDYQSSKIILGRNWKPEPHYSKVAFDLNDLTIDKEFDIDGKFIGLRIYNDYIFSSVYPNDFLSIYSYSDLTKLKEFTSIDGGVIDFTDTFILSNYNNVISLLPLNTILNHLDMGVEYSIPIVQNYTQITIEPQYNTSLYNHLGQDQSIYINNNIIDKSALPTGIYFLHIQNSTYNKVLKFYKEN
jgi:hypothetical protein